MELITFIQDLAIVLIFAGIVSILFSRLNQPAIFGYLVAGCLIGPHALQFVNDVDTVGLFAELSVIFLIFSIGLEFNLKKLRKVGGVALFTGIFEMIVIMSIGNAAGRLLGLSHLESIYLGGILAISSTAIIAKILVDLKQLNKEYAQIILGILIVEDIGAVILLTVFGSIAMLGDSSFMHAVIGVILKIVLFFVIALVIGLKVIPHLINKIGDAYSHEILLIIALGLCFGLAAFSSYLGFSAALGAFIMGAIISESKSSSRTDIKKSMAPIRILFSIMFFISIGMLVNPFLLKDILFVIGSIAVLAIGLKILCCGLGVYLSGYRGVTALHVGMGLIPIGEFSFVMAKQGIDAGLISQTLFQATVAVAMITTLLAPHALGSADELAAHLYRGAPLRIKELFNYTSYWISSLHKQLCGEIARSFKNKLTDIAVNVIIIIFILLLLSGINTAILKQSSSLIRLLSFVIAGIFTIPSIYRIYKKLTEIIDLFIEILEVKYGIFSNLIIKMVLRNLIYALIVVILSLTIFPILIAELASSDYIIVLILVAVVGLCGYFLWKTVMKFHNIVEVLICETLLAQDLPPDHEDIDIFEHLERENRVSKLRISDGSSFVGKTIADTRLRTTTGATVLFIARRGTFIDPLPTLSLEKGDVLILLGSEEARESALTYLSE